MTILQTASFTHKTFHLFQVYLSPSQHRQMLPSLPLNFKCGLRVKLLRVIFFFHTIFLKSYFWSTHLWVFEELKNTSYEKFGIFSTVKLLCNDTVKVDACHYTFVKTHRVYNSRASPNVNYGFWGDNDVFL